MSALRRHLVMVGVAAITGLAGCQTPAHLREALPPNPADEPDDLSLALQSADLADSLANYAVGLMSEAKRDPDSIYYFALAAELTPEALQPYLRMAEAFVRRQDMEGARQVLRNAIEANPAAREPKFFMAEIAMMMQDTNAAQAAWLDCIAAAPEDDVAYVKLAMLFFQQDREAEGVATLEEALQKLEKPVNALRFLGDHFAGKSDSSDPGAREPILKRAVAYYERAVEQPPDEYSHAYLERLGNVYLRLRRFEKANECFKALSKAKPEEPKYLSYLTYCNIELGRPEEALAYMRPTTNNTASTAAILVLLAGLFENIGDYENAETSYHDAALLDPENPEPLVKLALMLSQFDVDAAIHTLETALSREPGDIPLLQLLIHINVSIGRLQDALKIYESAQDSVALTNSHEDVMEFFINFAMLANAAKQPELAEKLLKNAMTADPQSVEPYLSMALFLIEHDKVDAAIATMQRAIVFFKDSFKEPRARFYLAVILNRTERFTEALEFLEQTEKQANKMQDEDGVLDASFFFNYGATLERLGRFDEAAARLLRAIEMDPDHADALNYLAYMWAEKGMRLNEAMTMILRALELDPQNAAYIDTMGWIYFQTKKFEDALQYLCRAHAAMPDDPTILDHLGDAYMELGRYEEAVEAWQAALEQQPSNNTIRAKLSELGAEPTPDAERKK